MQLQRLQEQMKFLTEERDTMASALEAKESQLLGLQAQVDLLRNHNSETEAWLTSMWCSQNWQLQVLANQSISKELVPNTNIKHLFWRHLQLLVWSALLSIHWQAGSSRCELGLHSNTCIQALH